MSALRWLPAAAYMALIFYGSSRQSVPVPHWFEHQDKVHHFLAYSGLGFLLALAFDRGPRRRRFWLALTVAALYGVSDEFHQSFVPGRECSFWDWCADAAGSWWGVYVALRSEGLWRRSLLR